MKKGVEKTDLYQLHLLSGLKASPSGNSSVGGAYADGGYWYTGRKICGCWRERGISVSIRSRSFPSFCGKMNIRC